MTPFTDTLKIVETYEYYDQPVLFLCASEYSQYLTVLVDDTDNYEQWFYARVSPERLNLIKKGGVGLYDAFKSSEDGYVLSTKRFKNGDRASTRIVFNWHLRDSELPERGALLFETIDLSSAHESESI